jgi:hypothetical protein
MQTMPTWKNSRLDKEGVSKRLHRFIVSHNLMNLMERIRSLIKIGGGLEYLPTILQVEFRKYSNPRNPSKFNLAWLEDEEYITLVKNK